MCSDDKLCQIRNLNLENIVLKLRIIIQNFKVQFKAKLKGLLLELLNQSHVLVTAGWSRDLTQLVYFIPIIQNLSIKFTHPRQLQAPSNQSLTKAVSHRDKKGNRELLSRHCNRKRMLTSVQVTHLYIIWCCKYYNLIIL